MNKLLGITAVAGLMLAASPAFADWPHHQYHDQAPHYYHPYQHYQYRYQYQQPWHRYGIDARQQQQHWRIQQGIRSGDLTRGEARELLRDEREIRREEQAYRADGYLSRDERRDLQQDLNALSRDIHDERHDGQRRGW